MSYNLVWYDVEAKFEVLEVWKGGTKIEVPNVGGAETCSGFRYRGVKVAFDGCEVSGSGTLVAEVINKVASHGEACTVCFGFVFADVTH